MVTELYASAPVMFSGLVAGSLFGFLLQRGGVSEFNVIVRQFLFKDFTVLKIMLTAIVVGGFALHGLQYVGVIPVLSVTMLPNLGVLVGGLIFGVGMATLGLCPGTCVAAAGQGSRDAWVGLLGMFTGALLFISQATHFYGTIIAFVLTPAATLGQLFGVSPFLILGVLLVCTLILFKLLKNR